MNISAGRRSINYPDVTSTSEFIAEVDKHAKSIDSVRNTYKTPPSVICRNTFSACRYACLRGYAARESFKTFNFSGVNIDAIDVLAGSMHVKIQGRQFPLLFCGNTLLMHTIFRGMDQATLDLAYNNSAAVPDAAQIMDAYIQRSQDAYVQYPCHRDISYGNRARQRFDWFAAPQGSGVATVVFLHGGYWQSRSKEDFAFIVAGPLALGFNVVLAEYTLAPEAKMTGIVAEIGQLLHFLESHGEFGGSPSGTLPQGRKLVLAGHSAGGQLAAHFRNHRAVSGVLAISGLFDLEPIRLSNLNDKLRLSPSEVAAFSPCHHIAAGVPTQVIVGAAERPELIRQSEDYARDVHEMGEAIELHLLAGHNHFSILEELAAPSGALAQALQVLAV